MAESALYALFLPFATCRHVSECDMARTATPAREIVTYGGAKASVWARGDGRWVVSWSEHGRSRSTTYRLKDAALRRARKIVRDLVAGLGTRAVTIAESELVAMLLRVCGDRSPVGVLGELEDALRALHGVPLRRVVSHWLASGLASLERVKIRTAVNRFLDSKEDCAATTLSGLRKELNAFCRVHYDLELMEIESGFLEAWIGRECEDGTPPAARYFNNRLATWVNFYNSCRDNFSWWPRGEKHPAEQIKKREEADTEVPIWSPATAHAILRLLWSQSPRQVPYLVIGCWLGLRPSEIPRLRWEHFDWRRDYLHCDHTVARKLKEQRYVPLHAKARALMERWLREQGLWDQALRGELMGKVTFLHDGATISALAKAGGIIQDWPQDVMRHSCISYHIAAGRSKGQIAEWSGNSEATIRQSYRRPLRRHDGEEWESMGELDGCRALA